MISSRILALLLPLAALAVAACSAPEPVEPQGDGATQTASARTITDVAIPSGADQVFDDSLVLGGADRWTGRLVLKTELDPVDAFAFYQDRMPGLGWEPLASIQSEVSVLSFARAGRVATVQIEDRTFGGSRVSITMAPRQEAVVRRARRANDIEPAAGEEIEVQPLNN